MALNSLKAPNKANENLTLSNTSYDANPTKRPRLLACRNYSAKDLEKAVQESRFGVSAKELSIKYNIPRSTISNHKNNNSAKIQELTNYSLSDLNNALQDTVAGMSVINSSRKYNIPYSTIYYHKKKNNLKRNTEDTKANVRQSYEPAVLKTWPSCAGVRNYLASDLGKTTEACKTGLPLDLSCTESSRKYTTFATCSCYTSEK